MACWSFASRRDRCMSLLQGEWASGFVCCSYAVFMSEPILIEELSPPPDPWEAVQRLASLPRLLFLDSAGGPASISRYSYLMAEPVAWFESMPEDRVDPLAEIRKLLARRQTATRPGLPPFQGGVAGLLSYDLNRRFERVPLPRRDPFRVPECAIGAYDWVIAWDHVLNNAWLVAPGRDGRERSRRILDRLAGAPVGADFRIESATVEPAALHPVRNHPGVFSNFSADAFRHAIRRAIDYTHAGDCFQVNLAQRLVTRLTEPTIDIYRRLRTRNPAPFSAYFDLGDVQLLSASPERFVSVASHGAVEARPIKGTCPRGRTPCEDHELVQELLRSPKDRAENVMIVDLLRNDLGRVCEFGSINVADVCRLETYPTVHHLVSEVRGRLRRGQSSLDLIRAAFPGGSVTGAPKVRAMEIIAELEPDARGPYCGSLGWLGYDGAMDLNILIRTFTAARGWLQFPVGGGIVADSDPEREYDETLHKAAGLLRALAPA